MHRSVVLVALVVLAGCAAPAPEPVASTTQAPTTVDPDLRILGNGTGLPAAFEGGFEFDWKNIGFSGTEPTMGIAASGALFMAGFEPGALGVVQTVLRSTDGGTTWEQLANPTGSPSTFETMLWVDEVTGRVFAHQLTIACAWLSASDDEGETWIQSPVSCGTPGIDHQKIATGPYAAGSPFAPASGNPAYPNHVSMCYNKIGGTFCSISVNGGLTFVYEGLVDINTFSSGVATDRGCGGLNGHQTYAPDGTIYVPYGLNCGLAFVGVSTDGGFSWTPRRLGFSLVEADPAVAVTTDGTAYYLYRSDDQRMHLLRSSDRFVTFDGPWDITPPEVSGTIFPTLVAGSEGRIAWSFLGHTTPFAGEVPNATNAPAEARWHLYAGMSLDADGEAPTFVTRRVTSDNDPVQVGPIWEGGGGDPSRNLLNYNDMVVAPDGRLFIAFGDGCISEACKGPDATPDDSRDQQLAFARLVSGPSLFGGRVG
ncbi:MAG: sialidase family protein [Candidatus Thermoplasmatota archaeon]